jgi:hypothetical protein
MCQFLKMRAGILTRFFFAKQRSKLLAVTPYNNCISNKKSAAQKMRRTTILIFNF